MWTSNVLSNLINSKTPETTNSGESIKYSAIAGDLKGSFYLPLDFDETVTCFCR